MENCLIKSSLVLIILYLAACSDSTDIKIKKSLADYVAKRHPGDKSLLIDSVTYLLADSTIYYNHFLKSLEEKSESFSRMARLRDNLAQSHMNDFLSGTSNNIERNKTDVDKSLEALKQNERDWNVINDSMDLLLNAIHVTDISKKVFYDVRFLLTVVSGDKKTAVSKRFILNMDDFKVVVEE